MAGFWEEGVIMYKVKKIYYLLETGEPIWDVSYSKPKIISLDEDYQRSTSLQLYTKESIGLLVLENGAYSQEFSEANDYRVNPETKELEFSYPDPNNPEEPPVFGKPLTDQIEELKIKQVKLDQSIAESHNTQQDLLELLIDMGVI